MRGLRRKVICAVAPALLAAAPASAQQCMRIDSDPPMATVTARSKVGTVAQSTPSDFCQLKPGVEYILTIDRRNYEKRSVKFSFADYGEPARFSPMWPSMMLRSVVLPGWGQSTMAQGGRTAETWVLLGTDGVKSYQAWKEYDHAKKQYRNAKALADLSDTQEELETRSLEAAKRSMDANSYQDAFWATAAIGGWIYLHNLVETFLLAEGPKTVRGEGTNFTLVSPRKSGTRAAIRSMFFPGLGQLYVGHGGRSFLYRSGIFALALFTVDAKLRYDLAVNDRDAALMRYNALDSADAKNSMLPELVTREKSVKDREDRVTAFLVATGALWIANVVDAWGAGWGEDRSDRFEASASYRGGTLWSSVTWRF